MTKRVKFYQKKSKCVNLVIILIVSAYNFAQEGMSDDQLYHHSIYAILFQVASDLVGEVKNKHQAGGKVIVSSYLNGATPSKEDLGHLVARMQATGADIIKVVSNADDITELERIFHLLSHCEV